MIKKEEPKRKDDESAQAEMLEDRIALAILNPKKGPEPPPYPPGALYGLIERRNLPRTED